MTDELEKNGLWPEDAFKENWHLISRAMGNHGGVEEM